MPISIYPPTLQSTQVAFAIEGASSYADYEVRFALQTVTSESDIGHIQLRLVKQKNNKSIINGSTYPDRIIYRNWKGGVKKIEGTNYYVFTIKESNLGEPWEAGCLYKVQMRFGTTSYDTTVPFATWKQAQIDSQTFSEWSNVMVIKAIKKPDIVLQNATLIDANAVSSIQFEQTLTPQFIGVYSSTTANNEAESKYRFTLYSGDSTEDYDKIETSGWLAHEGADDRYRFKIALTSGNKYTVIYEVETVNGYVGQAKKYYFEAAETYLSTLTGVTMQVESDTQYCRDNGCINLYLTTESSLNGAYVLTRASEVTNYEVWEDLQFFILSQQSYNNELLYRDFTIESGVRYKYAFQMENKSGLRTTRIYVGSNAPVSVNFEYGYLYRDGVQLKLKFNQKMSTFKHTTLTAKQDTLGDKYPHLTKNGSAYYAEFPVSGLISFHMDDDRTFFTLGKEGFYYGDELVIPRDKFAEVPTQRVPCVQNSDTSESLSTVTNYNDLNIDYSLAADNFFVERKFREKVEEFLNAFNYKLYRSPSEGNMVVGLMNVSLTPNATLGRMIYEFTATAYEVAENTLENLDSVGIISIGSFSVLTSDDISLSFGQIKGVYTRYLDEEGNETYKSQDVYEKIREQEEISVGGGYKLQLERLRAFKVEGYPVQEFRAELLELQAQKANLENAGEDTSEIDALIQEHESLQRALQGPAAITVKLKVNGKEILVLPNRIYSLREPVTSLEVTSAVTPIIIHYVCELSQQVDLSVGVISAIDTSRIWGQISGIFTGTDEVLKTYNYDYGPGEVPYRVYSGEANYPVMDIFGRYPLVDDTHFNLYKTINLLDVVKEETRHQVEYLYNIEGQFYLDENGDWTDGSIYYTFSDIIELDIEADAGTILKVGQKVDGSDAIKVMIGTTGRYTLNPSNELIQYLAFEQPTYALINYKCLTNQTTMQKG